jgi:hypothetical protein
VFNENVSIVSVACVPSGGNPCGRYLYSAPNDQTATSFSTASLWQVRLGVRFDF